MKQRYRFLVVFTLILCAASAIAGQAAAKKNPSKPPAKPAPPVTVAPSKNPPAPDKAAKPQAAAPKKDAPAGNNPPADPGNVANPGGSNSPGANAAKDDKPPTIRANFASLQCDSNPAAEPARSLCKYVIPLHHQKAADIQPLIADQAEGFSVKAVGDNLLVLAPAPQNSADGLGAGNLPKPAQSSKPQGTPPAKSKPARPEPVPNPAENAKQIAEAKQKQDDKEAATLLRLRRLVATIDTANSAQNSIIRLYNERDADKTAAALGGMANPLGPDLLVVAGKNPTAASLARQAAILDLPRPVVTLNVWNVELSTRTPGDLDSLESTVNRTVEDGNDVLREALEGGWEALLEKLRKPSPFDSDFKNYIGLRFMSCADKFDVAGHSVPGTGSEECGDDVLRAKWNACAKDQYCLGYTEAFIWGKPSLSKIIFLLASLKDPTGLGEEIATKMESKGIALASHLPSRALPSQPESCSTGSTASTQLQTVKFPQFGARLEEALKGERLKVLRASIADFLFQYKWSYQYPNEFIPYDLSHSADKLDGQFAPIVEGFNQDVETYLTELFHNQFTCTGQSKKVTFYSSGAVTLSANSGAAAQVTVDTANKFDTTPSFTIAQYMTALGDAEKNLPDLAKATPYAQEIAAASALLNTQKPSSVNIGKTFDLQVTPTSLATGSAVDLNIKLTSNEDANGPGEAGSGGDSSTKTDDTSRVVSNKVIDDVRIETQRLFQVSSFAAALRRGRNPFIVPLLGELPFLGPVFQFPRRPESIYHRTFAIAHALVVPTAQDLGYSIRFDRDRQLVANPGGLPTKNQFYASSYDLPPVLSFHKRKMECWLNVEPSDCTRLTFADLPEDAGSK